MLTFDEYKENFKFEKYEQTSCIVYELYLRAEKKEINYKDLNNNANYFNINESRIKDIILYEYNEQKFTLQNIIYNIYPDLYVDSISFLTQKEIFNQINTFLENFKNVKQYPEFDKLLFVKYFEDLRLKFDVEKNILNYDDEFFERNTINELIKIRKEIEELSVSLIEIESKKNKELFKSDHYAKLENLFEDFAKDIEYKSFSNLINEYHNYIREVDEFKNIYQKTTTLNLLCVCIDNIIKFLYSYIDEIRNHSDDELSLIDIDYSMLTNEIISKLNDFSFSINYLKKYYFDNKDKEFIPQIIFNPLNKSYIKITKKYILDLLNNYILMNKLEIVFKRPIFKLHKDIDSNDLININLKLPEKELIAYIKELKRNRTYNNLTKIIMRYNNKNIDIEYYLENLEDCTRILYIYDYAKKYKRNFQALLKTLSIEKGKYYILKNIAKELIEKKRYKELYGLK